MARKKDTAPKKPAELVIVAEASATPELVANGLEAMVNERTRFGTINAFSGFEYVRYEWRAVPAGYEEQAQAHPYLNTRPRMVSTVEVELENAVGATDEEIVTDETGDDGAGVGDDQTGNDGADGATDEG